MSPLQPCKAEHQNLISFDTTRIDGHRLPSHRCQSKWEREASSVSATLALVLVTWMQIVLMVKLTCDRVVIGGDSNSRIACDAISFKQGGSGGPEFSQMRLFGS